MAKWPKDSPGTWYSHYKRGSLVSGPAGGPGRGLDFVCLMLCMVLVPQSMYMVVKFVVVPDEAWAALTIQSRNTGDALGGNGGEVNGSVQARFAVCVLFII